MASDEQQGRRQLWLIVVQLVAINVLGLAAIFYIFLTDLDEIRASMGYWTVMALKAGLWGVLVGAVVEWRRFRAVFGGVPRAVWYQLGVWMIVGLYCVLFWAPRINRINWDEHIYMDVAHAIAATGQASLCDEGKAEQGRFDCFRKKDNKQPNGHPFMESLLYSLFGVSESNAHTTNNITYLLGVLAVFGCAYLFFGCAQTAVYSAAIYAMTPMVVIWSNTASAEVGAGVWSALAVFGAIWFAREQSWGALLLAAGTLAIAVQYRPESILCLPVVFLLLLVLNWRLLLHPRFYSFLLLVFLLCLPQALQLWSVRFEKWGAAGDKFGLEVFAGNAKTNFLYLVDNRRLPLVFTLAALAGVAAGWRRRQMLPILAWFAAFFGVYLFFYAGSYNYGADVRYAAVMAPAMSVLAGMGLTWVIDLLSPRFSRRVAALAVYALFFVSFLPFFALMKTESEEGVESRVDINRSRDFAQYLPEASLVLSQDPGMWFLWGKNAAQTYLASENPDGFEHNIMNQYPGGIYFYWGFWCNVGTALDKKWCQNILRCYKAEVVKEYWGRGFRHVLYKVDPSIPGNARECIKSPDAPVEQPGRLVPW